MMHRLKVYVQHFLMKPCLMKPCLRSLATCALAAALCSVALFDARSAAAWEPSKTVEFVVPAGTGGGADQMARFLQGVIAKHNLMKQPLVAINKSGGGGAAGVLRRTERAGGPPP